MDILIIIMISIGFVEIGYILELFNKNNIINKYIYYLLAVIIMYVASTVSESIQIPVLMLLFIGIFIFEKYKYKKENQYIKLILIPIIFIMYVVSDLFIGLIDVFIFRLDFKYMLKNQYIIIANNIMVTVIAIIIAKILKKYIYYIIDNFIYKKAERNEYKDIILLSIVNIGLLVMIVFGTFFVLKIDTNINSKILDIYLLANFLYIIIFIINSKNIKKTFDKSRSIIKHEAQLEALKKYNESIEIIYSEVKNFKHDYTNILSGLSTYIEEKDYEGLSEYFNNNIIKYSNKFTKENNGLINLKYIKVNSLKGLIYSKLIKAEEMNVNLLIDIVEEIKYINIGEVELTRVLGIILDNALEAATEIDNKEVRIGLIKSKKSVVIVVTNFIKEDIPPLYKLSEKGFSTKGQNRGIGLYNLKSIIDKYKNVNLDTKIENNQFIQVLDIYE